MKIDRFEDLESWKETRESVNLVYAAVNSNPLFQKDLRLNGRITGAAVSVMNNTAEGCPDEN
jgi:four helix bundle protein